MCVDFLGVTLFFSCLFVLNVLYYICNIQALTDWRQVPNRAAYILFLRYCPGFYCRGLFLLLGLNRSSFCFRFPYKLVKSIRSALLCSDSNGFFEYSTSLKYDSFRLLMQNLYKKSFVCIDKFVNCAIIEA